MLKKCFVVIIVILAFVNFFNPVYASAIDDSISDGDNFISLGETGVEYVQESKLKTFSDTIYNILLLIGMVLAVIIGSIIGIKFMISSVEEKAKVKEILMIYVIGCCVLLGAFTIWKIAINVLNF